MNNPRSSVDDYPEHLNPFYEGDAKLKFWKLGKVKRSSSFGESLRNTLLFKSIRGKKKEKDVPVSPLVMRKSANVEPLYRQTLPTISTINSNLSRNSTPVPLPRSRFSERVTKLNPTEISEGTQTAAPNPFLENGGPKPPARKYIKRKKRRAPLPPTSDGSTISSTHNLSKWSLTSDGTDISMYSDSEYNLDPEASLRIASISNEIQKLAQDVHEELCQDQTCPPDIPDVVVSSIDGTQTEKSYRKSIDSSTDENFNVVSETSLNDEVENNGPDVVHHTNCNECDVIVEEQTHVDTIETTDDMVKVDTLTNLINSINADSTNVDDKDFELKEVDSLTNIINSINFTENEIFESKFISEQSDEIINCDNGSVESDRSDEEVRKDDKLKDEYEISSKLKQAEEDHPRV